MPAKTKKDIKNAIPPKDKESVDQEQSVLEKPKLEDSKIVDKPKITSFSQLDTVKSQEQKDKPRIVTEELQEAPEEQTTQVDNLPSDTDYTQQTITSDEKDTSPIKENVTSEDVKEWLKDVRPDTSKEIEKGGKSMSKVFFSILIILILIAAVVGGIFYYTKKVSNKDNNLQKVKENLVSEKPTQTPTATPVSEDLTKFSLSILNGSGITGEAAKVSGLLKEKGFAEAKTANADSYNYTKTIISLKESVPTSVYEKIKDTLLENYTVEKSDTALKDDSEFDIIIIVGSRKK